MKKIYSKTDPDVLLAIITDFSDFNSTRVDVIPDTEFLQSALVRINEGTSFRPHKHIWKPFTSMYNFGEIVTQEAWIVVRGMIKVNIYDTDDTLAETTIVNKGGACFTIHGGHTLESLEDYTCIVEIKNGPYQGQIKDKVFI